MVSYLLHISRPFTGLKQSLENCRHTSNLSGAYLVERLQNITKEFGTIRSFKAYGDLSLEYANPKSANLHSQLQSSGVSLVHCPHNGGKDVADKMLLGRLTFHIICSGTNTPARCHSRYAHIRPR